MRVAKPTEDPLVAQAFDRSKHDELARAIQELSPDEAAFFLAKLEAALNKRKLQLTGYVVALIAWAIGMAIAMAYYGIVDGFTGWVFLVPFAIVGVLLWLFGRWAERVGAALPEPVPPATLPRPKTKR